MANKLSLKRDLIFFKISWVLVQMSHFKMNPSHISSNVYHWFTQQWTTTLFTATPLSSTDPILSFWKKNSNCYLRKTEAATNTMYTRTNARFKSHWPDNVPGSSSQKKTDNWNWAKLLTFYLLLSRATRLADYEIHRIENKNAVLQNLPNIHNILSKICSTKSKICWGTFNIT